jgi:uncharacterized protein YkwD
MQLSIARPKYVTRLALILAVAIGMLAFAPAKAEASNSLERYMAGLINNARVHAGRKPLVFSEMLSNYARTHSATMASKDDLYHNPYLAKWLKHHKWKILGENVGVGYSIPTLHQAFMASPAHKENILDKRFKSVGVGMTWGHGRLWVTIVFRG